MGLTALLMIDFQRDFCEAGGYSAAFAGLDWVTPIIAPARRLLEGARRAGHLVIHTREGYAPDLSDCSPMKLKRSRDAGAEIGSKGPMGRLLIRGEHGHDIIDALAPAAGRDRHRQGVVRRVLRHEPGVRSCAVGASTRWSSPG